MVGMERVYLRADQTGWGDGGASGRHGWVVFQRGGAFYRNLADKQKRRL